MNIQQQYMLYVCASRCIFCEPAGCGALYESEPARCDSRERYATHEARCESRVGVAIGPGTDTNVHGYCSDMRQRWYRFVSKRNDAEPKLHTEATRDVCGSIDPHIRVTDGFLRTNDATQPAVT